MNEFRSPPRMVMHDEELRRLRRKSRLQRALAMPMTAILVVSGLPFTTIGWLSEKCLDVLQFVASLTVHRLIRSARLAEDQAEEIMMLPAPQPQRMIAQEMPRRAQTAPMVNADEHWESLPLPQANPTPTPEHWGRDYHHYAPAVEDRMQYHR